MPPLTPDEHDQVSALIPLLERAARRSRRLPREEAYSAGYDGLVKAIRTHDPDRGDLQAWASLCIVNAIGDAAKQEGRHRARVYSLEHDVVDRASLDAPDPRREAIEELPPYLREVVEAYLHTGSIEGAAAELGRGRETTRDLFEIAKEILISRVR